MQTVKITLLILICLFFLGACGLKGALYLPEEESPVEQTTPAETDEDKDEESNTG